MDSLENKLDRLSPQDRREVEDFVDFLLQRSGGAATLPVMVNPQPAYQAPPVMKAAPVPLILPETLPADDVQETRAPAPAIRTVVQVKPLPRNEETAPSIQEITVGDDRSDNYLDYGKYERPAPVQLPPSPADEAIKKVKIKLIKKGETDSKTKLLDWID
ncbi:MAG: hypothetical protein WC342_01500 [Methanoregula sp.]|jgi:hypothetical protein